MGEKQLNVSPTVAARDSDRDLLIATVDNNMRNACDEGCYSVLNPSPDPSALRILRSWFCFLSLRWITSSLQVGDVLCRKEPEMIPKAGMNLIGRIDSLIFLLLSALFTF